MVTMDYGGEEEEDVLDMEPPAPKKPRVSGISQNIAPEQTTAQERRSQMAVYGAEEKEEEPTAPKRSRIAGPRGNSGSNPAGSSAHQVNPNRSTPRAAFQVRQTERATSPSGVDSGAQQAKQDIAPGHALIKEEEPEYQNTLGPIDVKPELQHYPAQQPQRNGVLPLAVHNSFLKAMHTMIYAQKLPIDQNVVLKMREASEGIERMQLIGAPNPNEIPIDDFVTTIHHTVLVARRNTFNFCVEESRSLRDFLLLLHFSIANLMMMELEELEAKLMESIEDPENLNKRIPINKINKVLESILELLVPN
ncbi:unnamed protein product [Caenorhabditis brenneri]